jgi:hypothetical protein
MYPASTPQMSFIPDTTGWYTPVPITPFSPVNIPNPPLLPPTFLQHPEPTSPLEKVDQIQIHDFWQGRLAPFPGFTSRPGLFPVKKHQSVKINNPASTSELPKLQLLPPRSMINSTYINMPPTNDSSSSSEITENNKVSPFYRPLLSSHRPIRSNNFNSINM